MEGETGLTAEELQSVELGDDEELAAVLLEGQVAEPLEDLGHLQRAPVQGNTEELLEIHSSSSTDSRDGDQPEEPRSHQDPCDVEQSHARVDHVGVLDHPKKNHSEELT